MIIRQSKKRMKVMKSIEGEGTLTAGQNFNVYVDSPL
jgi:hypothetical protein